MKKYIPNNLQTLALFTEVFKAMLPTLVIFTAWGHLFDFSDDLSELSICFMIGFAIIVVEMIKPSFVVPASLLVTIGVILI